MREGGCHVGLAYILSALCIPRLSVYMCIRMYVCLYVCVRVRVCVAICVHGVIYYEYALFGTFQSINMNFQRHDNENFIKKLCIIQISVQRMSE